MSNDGRVPEPLDAALEALRPLLCDLDQLVRAVAAGRRRAASPAHLRADLRPVDLKTGRHLQVTTTDGRTPTTTNHGPPGMAAAVDALLAEPFGTWFVETLDRVVQLRVTKRGEAQVHTSGTSRRVVQPTPRAHDRERHRLLDPGDPLFDALGADADKRRQVDAFLRQLEPMVVHAVQAARGQGRPVHVLDLGCGNAYLTFAAHRFLTERVGDELGVHTVGIDQRPDMVARNARLAAELGLDGLAFGVGEIATADPGPAPVDLVLALHACDTATDDALARAVQWQTPLALAAPCCHHDIQRRLQANRRAGTEIPEPYQAIWRHRILGQRFADVLTDALRADVLRVVGFEVDVVEFVDSRHTPRNALLRVRRRPGGLPEQEYRRRVTELNDLTRQWSVRPRLAELLQDRFDELATLGASAPSQDRS
ncbi:MAG: SAM-dependent methyltransferase [Kineosporiaceae bacterium]|nr:SAM-dependent methyltransferase [Kineosporiaceae bacterium]